MDFTFIAIGFCLFMLISFLYASVGHAGASGYLAVMAFLSFPVDSIKPTSLFLNIIVSAIASYKFIKAGYFDRKVFLAFAFTSMPFAFIGGYIKIDPYWFKIFAGIFLICSAIMLIAKEYVGPSTRVGKLNIFFTLIIGALIGLISGLLGIGGGVFLSPIIILSGYATIKVASGIAALFILFNSILGLTGHYVALKMLEFDVLYWVFAVSIGGYMGSHFGSQKFNNKYILFFLFLVLTSAGLKFILVG